MNEFKEKSRRTHKDELQQIDFRIISDSLTGVHVHVIQCKQ
jgi:hypothetical protein